MRLSADARLFMLHLRVVARREGQRGGPLRNRASGIKPSRADFGYAIFNSTTLSCSAMMPAMASAMNREI
jgi:hypothetical protein